MRQLFLLGVAGLLLSGAGRAADDSLSPARVQEIIKKFAAKETEFARARENYTYRQYVKLEELDEENHPEGRYEIVTDVIFTPDGKRTERVVYAPVPTLQHLQLTPEDEQDLRQVQPFVLTTDEIPKYYIRYLGKQTLDEIPCYTFAVKPKRMVKGERYFEGLAWVDDRDLQIVKTYGRGVGLIKKKFDNKFPKFETYRQQIDGKYWFPTFTIANDVLMFRSGPQPIKLIIKYKDYKKFGSRVRIHYGGTVPENKPPAKPKQP